MKKFLVFTILCLSLTVFGCSKKSSQGGGGEGGGGNPSLSYSPSSIDFGEVFADVKSSVMGITISNNGQGGEISITSFQMNPSVSDSFVIDPSSTCATTTKLKVGESCFIDIAVDSVTNGRLEAALEVATNGGSISVPLKAVVKGLEPNKFVSVTDYPSYNSKLVVASSGTIYAVSNNMQVLQYNPQAGSWKPLQITVNPVSASSSVRSDAPLFDGFSVSALGGKLYLIGGIKEGVNYSDKIYSFDISKGVWSDATPAGYVGTASHTSTTVGGKIYIIGGFNGSDANNQVIAVDPTSNSMETLTKPAFSARSSHAAAVVGSKIYVFGGENAQGDKTNDMWAFDTLTKEWTEIIANGVSQVAPMTGSVMVADDNTLYLYGGQDNNDDPKRTLYEYDTSISGSDWNFLRNDDPFKSSYNGSGVYSDGLIYIISGLSLVDLNFEGKDNNFWSYDVNSGIYKSLKPSTLLPIIDNSSSVSLGSDAYFVGGQLNGEQSYSASLYKFNIRNREAFNVTPSEGPSLPRIIFPSLASDGGSFYIFGGRIISGGSPAQGDAASNGFVRYNPQTERLEEAFQSGVGSASPGSRYGAASVAVGDKIYVIGGMDGNGSLLNDTWIFDNSSKTWSQTTNNPLGTRAFHVAVEKDAKIYVYSGQEGVTSYSQALNVFNTGNSGAGWDTVSTSSQGTFQPRKEYSAAIIGDKLYIFGGKSGEKTFYDLWVVDLVNAENSKFVWKPIQQLNIPLPSGSPYQMYKIKMSQNIEVLWFFNPQTHDLRYFWPKD